MTPQAKNGTIKTIKWAVTIILVTAGTIASGYAIVDSLKTSINDNTKGIYNLESKVAVQAVSDSAFKADTKKQLDTLNCQMYKSKKTQDTLKQLITLQGDKIDLMLNIMLKNDSGS